MIDRSTKTMAITAVFYLKKFSFNLSFEGDPDFLHFTDNF